jgi:heptaprenyl diphosphate synthase
MSVTTGGCMEITFEAVDSRVREYLHHPFMASANVRQSFSRFHFDVACAILSKAKVAPERAQSIIESILLLQEGLSIHDDVDQGVNLRRQLYVLSGDYSSSRYYWVLARIGEHGLLQKLSQAVIKINEAKMWLLEHADSSEEEYMKLQEIVTGELLYALADHFLPPSDELKPHVRSLVKAHIDKRRLESEAIAEVNR